MSWLFMFLLHSTLWLLIAWIWIRLRPNTHARIRETIWTTAIAACFITPTVQTLDPLESALWRVSLPETLVSISESDHDEQETTSATMSLIGEHDGGEHQSPLTFETAKKPLALIELESPPSWKGAAHWIWLSIAGSLVLFYFGRLMALRLRLSKREIVKNRYARQALSKLRRRAGLHKTLLLTESENLSSPIALGFGRRIEICVPTRALNELDQEQFNALLGHEIAHHLRRDTLRLCALNILQAAFFFQPLFRLAFHAFHYAAEEQCDDWASRQLNDKLSMASCLAEVAAWALPRDRRLPVPSMTRRHSHLKVRVDRLLDEHRNIEGPTLIWRSLVAVGLLASATLFAPAMAPAIEHPDEISNIDQQITSEHNFTLDLQSELKRIEAQVVELKSYLQLLTDEHHKMAKAPKSGEQIEVIKEELSQLVQLRNILRFLDDVPSVELSRDHHR